MKRNQTGIIIAAIGLLTAGGCFSSVGAAEEKIPAFYEGQTENVQFRCDIVVPENFDAEQLPKRTVKQILTSDFEACLDIFGEGRKIAGETIYPADEYGPEWRYYTFEDAAAMAAGTTTIFSSENSGHYTQAFLHLSEKSKTDTGAELRFLSAQDSIGKVKELMAQIGLSAETDLKSYGLKAEEAQQWEEHLSHDGEYQEELYKQDWSEQDDAYLIYGYQTVQGIPVFHEKMFLGGRMKYLIPDNAAVQAIYTANGIENIHSSYLYQFEESDENVELQPFGRIADAVAERLSGTLTSEQYEVETAVLMELVKHNQEQAYEVYPIWYTEARSESGTTVVLIDASTAKGVFIA